VVAISFIAFPSATRVGAPNVRQGVELDRTTPAPCRIADCDSWLYMVYQADVSLEGILETSPRFSH
jgi:hypothetical protein